jgi:ATP-dependent RNA helicase DDX31/DBP7
MDDDTMFMNINTSNANNVGVTSSNKKEDKKAKYLEKKFLQKKRKRDNNQKRKDGQTGQTDNTEEGQSKLEQGAQSTQNPESEKKTTEHVYDELNEYYDNKVPKKPRLTNKEKSKNLEKVKIFENEIMEEIQDIQQEVVVQKINPKDSVFSIKNFNDLKINDYLKKSLAKNNYTQMTKVQKKSIPIMLEHKNVIVKSETGSGKTLAYLIPLYEMLYKLNAEEKIDRKNGVYSIIFAPTHELCLQIEETFNKLKSACINVVYGALMGGQKMDTEKSKLRKGLNVIIATPGRLLYHLKNTQNLKFDKLKLLIFDEADVLLSMGFDRDIKECLSIITKKFNPGLEEQELSHESFKKLKIFLISATMDNKIRDLVSFLMKGFKAVGFDTKSEEDEFESPIGLSQYYSVIYDEFRLIHLIAFILNNINKKIIVFVSNCDAVNFLSALLPGLEFDMASLNRFYDHEDSKPSEGFKLLNVNVYKLHGKMDHSQRKEIFKEFNKPGPSVLISTDVASRGLDFPHVDWIVHYDVNPDPKEYLNRMGRTARLDNAGSSLIFLMRNEVKMLETNLNKFKINELKPGGILLKFVDEVNKMIKENQNTEIEIKPEAYKDEVDENEKYRKKYLFAIYPLQKVVKNYLFKDKEHLNLARRAFKSSVRSYTTLLKYGKDIFNVKQLNLTRLARSFVLYKESTKIKLGNENYVVDYEAEKKNTKGFKKFNNKRTQKNLMMSEFQ